MSRSHSQCPGVLHELVPVAQSPLRDESVEGLERASASGVSHARLLDRCAQRRKVKVVDAVDLTGPTAEQIEHVGARFHRDNGEVGHSAAPERGHLRSLRPTILGSVGAKGPLEREADLQRRRPGTRTVLGCCHVELQERLLTYLLEKQPPCLGLVGRCLVDSLGQLVEPCQIPRMAEPRTNESAEGAPCSLVLARRLRSHVAQRTDVAELLERVQRSLRFDDQLAAACLQLRLQGGCDLPGERRARGLAPACAWPDAKGSKERLAEFNGEGLACVGRVRPAVRRTEDAKVLSERGGHGRIPSCLSGTNLSGATRKGHESATPHQSQWYRGGEAARNVGAETYHLMP